MSRKVPSFGQLIEYMSDIEKSEEKYFIYQNIYSRNLAGIESEFLENASLMKKRKNGVYLYHEILSITRAEKISLKQQKEILRHLAYEYATRRAPKNLVFGALHDDHDGHLHYHLCISANALGEPKKTRLSKAQFSSFKKDMEKHVLQKYPELEQELVINREAKEKLGAKEYELKKRTGKKSVKEQVKDELHNIFNTARDKAELFNMLSEKGFELYIRGKTPGVKKTDTGKKYRLKTLGLLDDFNRLESLNKAPEPEKPKTEKLTYTTDRVSTKVADIETEFSETEFEWEQAKEDLENPEAKQDWEDTVNGWTKAEEEWNQAKHRADDFSEFEYKKAKDQTESGKKYREKGEKTRKYKEEKRYRSEKEDLKKRKAENENRINDLDDLDKSISDNEKIKATLKKNREKQKKNKDRNKSR